MLPHCATAARTLSCRNLRRRLICSTRSIIPPIQDSYRDTEKSKLLSIARSSSVASIEFAEPQFSRERHMTKPHRREFLRLAAGAAALPAVSHFAWGQTYPTRPLRIIVGYPPGGVSDIVARIMAQWLSEGLGQPFIVENRPGASGNIATEAVVRAPPDGYTLLMVDASPIINAALDRKLNFNFIRDIAPTATIVRQPLVMVVHPSVPAK